MQKLELGTYPDGTDFYIYDQFLGDAFGIFSMTGYGKSILGGNIITQLAHQRPVIIFDYRGDYKNLKYFNFNSASHRQDAISDMVYLERFGFRISDFQHPFDWKMMGMTGNGAGICASRAKMLPYHKNNFQKFMELIEEVKVYGGSDAKGEAFRMTKQSIISKLQRMEGNFVTDANSVDITNTPSDMIRYNGTPFYISNWRAFVEANPHVCLNMHADYSSAKAQLYVGKIMNELEPAARKLHPVFLIEEAHVVYPANFDANDCAYSINKISHYLKELHKDGAKVILITQFPDQMVQGSLREMKRMFIGKLQDVTGASKIDEVLKDSIKLNYNYREGYREFLHYSPIYNQKDVFVPYDSFSRYEKRK